MKNNQFIFLTEKIFTSFADIFTMEKALFNFYLFIYLFNIYLFILFYFIFFLHNIFICESIFKIFVALFKTYGMQNGGMVIFFFWSFRKLRF